MAKASFSALSVRKKPFLSNQRGFVAQSGLIRGESLVSLSRSMSSMLRFAFIALSATATLHAVGTEFSKDVYPVLQRACFECHGPEKHKGDLRLDTASPQHLKIGTDLLRRVALPKEDKDAMPKRGERLTPIEIAHLRDWISSGAKWPDKLETLKHWSYIPPQRPALPAVKNQTWPKNEIDRFILAKLEANNLTPSPPAAPEILIRRLSLDLTGLPPTPFEVDAFKSDYIRHPASSIQHRATSRPPPRLQRIRRPLGTPLARPRPLCRLSRFPAR